MKIYPLLFSIFILSNCTSMSNRELIVLNGCQEEEASYDLEYSVNNNKSFLEENGINVRFEAKEGKCGYIILSKDGKKEINSVLTDIDLLYELKGFYNLD